MRTLCRSALAIGALALLVGGAWAQGRPGGGRPGGGFGPGGMLERLFDNKDVQKELNLTDDQVDKAKQVAKDVADKHKDDFAKLQDAPMEERMQKMMDLGHEVSKETLSELKDTLKPEQTKRLRQIMLQQRERFLGVGVFLDPEVEKELKLTDKQKDDLKTMAEDYRKEQREIFQGAAGNFQEARQKMDSLRKEKMEAADKVLTDDQKKSWKDMTGEPFEMRFEGRPGGGRPRDRNPPSQDK